jgi:uroporphyrinogen decarboxylase
MESIRLAVDLTRSGTLFIFGHGDICHPNDQAYLPVFLEAAATEPELVDRFFEATTQGMLPLVRTQLELGVDGILGATDWCFKSGPIMSPNMIRRFMIPHLKAIAQLTHQYGKLFVQHLDGNTESILPILIDEVGIDGYHAIEPTAGMDIAKLKQQYGNRITLLGNLDCGDILINKSPREIQEETRRLIRAAAPGGGFILSSSNAIHDAIPMENLQAMLQAAREYGVYPIQ